MIIEKKIEKRIQKTKDQISGKNIIKFDRDIRFEENYELKVKDCMTENNLITVPSFILFNKDKISKLNLDNLILCGESFPYKILNLLINKPKINNIYNCYGATELSPWAFYYKFNLKNIHIIKKFGKVPIGKPFKNIKYSFNIS